MEAPIVLSAVLGLALFAVDEKAFDKSFASLKQLGNDGKWSDEKRGLQKLLNEVGDQPWIRARRVEIAEEVKRAAVRCAVPQPDPATLIEGKLQRWDRATGDLTVAYGPNQWKDFEKEGDFLLHPAVFEEGFTLKFDGDDFQFAGTNSLSILVGVHDDEMLEISLGGRKDDGGGGYYPASIDFIHSVGGKNDVLASFEKAPLMGKHYELEVAVGATEIAVNNNGTRLGQAKRPPGFKGCIGISSRGPFKHFTLRGRATRAWLQEKLDAATHDAEEKFLAKWKPDDELPEWLRSDAAGAAGAAGKAGSGAARGPAAQPWTLTAEQQKVADAIEEQIAQDHEDDALKALAALKPGALPRQVRDWLVLKAHCGLDSLSAVADLVESFRNSHVDRADAQYFHAHLRLEAGDLEGAAHELAELRGKAGYAAFAAECVYDLVDVRLRQSKLDEAQQAIRDARADGVSPKELDELDLLLVNVRRGPNFPKRFEQESPHFKLVTDIDNDTARAALKVLEESYAICAQVFGKSDAAAKRFPVILFSGRAGYETYAGDKEFTHSSVGLYDPRFKQLLVWNQALNNDTTRTLRHETTHQYLDLLGYDVPVWFDEGLAGYVERIASSSKSDVKGGAVDRMSVSDLLEEKAKVHPLDQLVKLAPSLFYESAETTYDEAWALVHFLRHGTAFAEKAHDAKPASPDAKGDVAPEAIYQRLVAALQQHVAPEKAVQLAFDGVDMKRLEERFWEHVKRMDAIASGK
jgi:hypothetical protein